MRSTRTSMARITALSSTTRTLYGMGFTCRVRSEDGFPSVHLHDDLARCDAQGHVARHSLAADVFGANHDAVLPEELSECEHVALPDLKAIGLLVRATEGTAGDFDDHAFLQRTRAVAGAEELRHASVDERR